MPRPAVVRRAAALLLTDVQRHGLRRRELALRARRPGALDALAQHYGTDKSSAGHGYTHLYARHLGPRRRAVRSVLEIGVGGTTSREGYETPAGGRSLHMWSRYFPKAVVVGIDLHPKAVSGPRIRFAQGDQSDARFLGEVARRYGPFDVVIDDGSHIARHTVASFGALWPAVRPGGFYVIEDLAVSYHPTWEGGPPGTPGTAADLLKGLIDDTLRREQDSFRPSIASMHVYDEIAFLERAPL
jgi:demethylmacrocin O-methyltransferase